MSYVLAHGSFGETGIRLLKRLRKGDRQQMRDLTISVLVHGVSQDGFNTDEPPQTLSGRAIAERVYALGRDHCGDQLEPFAITLANHFVEHIDAVLEAELDIEERLWSRVMVSGRPRDRAFSGGGTERRTAVVRRVGNVLQVNAGFRDVSILRMLDEPPAVLTGTLSASWRYGWTDVPFGLHWQQVREVILETFADHAGSSAQQAIHAMAQAALDQCPPIAEIELTVRTSTYEAADLSRLGMNDTEDLLIPQDQPQSVMTITVRRDESR